MADPSLGTVVQAHPSSMIVDSFFDYAIPGLPIPVWLWILIFMVIVIIGTNFWWIYKWLVMKPLAGHGVAARSGNISTQQVLMFGLNRAFSVQALEYVEKVLSMRDPKLISKWLQTSSFAVGTLGYKSVMLVMNIFDQAKDPIAEMAICKACDDFNAGHNKDAIGDGEHEQAIGNYTDYLKYKEQLISENPDGIEIPIYAMYHPGKIQQFTPKNRTAAKFGGTCIKDAKELSARTEEESIWVKAAPLIICLIFGIIAMAFCYMYITSAPAHAATTAINASGV